MNTRKNAAPREIDNTPLQNASVEPLYVQLAYRITDAISSGRLAPGEQLPPESALMATFRISRVTVRQALQQLIKNGQLVSQRGKGTFVARTPIQQDLSSLQGFQEALRSQGVVPETELLEFSASAERPESGLPSGLNLPVRLRRLYKVDGKAFAVIEACLPAEAFALGESGARRLAVYDILQHFLGIRVVRADVAIQCAQPSRKVIKELDLPPRSHVLVMHRTSFTSDNNACEHMRIYIVPERYAFRMSVQGPLQLASAIRPESVST